MASGPNNVAGRLALITGASGGIGAAISLDLARLGVNLALTYSSNKSGVEKVVSDIRHLEGGKELRISIHQVDVGDAEAIARMFGEVREEHGGKVVDILISNAGYGRRIVDVWDIPIEEFDKTININLRASFILVKGVVEGMKEQKWGRIVFMSSIAAYGGGINGCHYASSKGGLMGMMKNLAQKLAPHNISVNDVAPALIEETGMLPNADAIPGGKESIPIQRLGKPEEVANVVRMFVVSGYVTGQSLVIAGGLK